MADSVEERLDRLEKKFQHAMLDIEKRLGEGHHGTNIGGAAHDERFDALEDKLRATFAEVEKRFGEQKLQPVAIEDRLQELEDLILLMQLEIMQLKERVGTQTEFLTANIPNAGERLTKLEEAVAGQVPEPDQGGEPLSLELTPDELAHERAHAHSHGTEYEGTALDEEQETPHHGAHHAEHPEQTPHAEHAHAKKSLLKEVEEILAR